MKSAQSTEGFSYAQRASLARQPGDLIGPQFLGFSGVAGFVAAWWFATKFQIQEGSQLTALFLAGTALPLVVLSLFILKTQWRGSAGISPEILRPRNLVRVGIKLLGLLVTLAGLSLAYWIFPEYSRSFYTPVWETLSLWALPVGCATVACFLWMDRRMLNPQDSYWQIGMFLLGQRDCCDRKVLLTYVLAWTVKGFFLPLMLAGAAENLPALVRDGLQAGSFALLYSTSIAFIYSLDVTYGALGYLLTLRALDAHIRSTEQTPLGWTSAIICYVPFSILIWDVFLKYKGRIQWHDWLAGSPVLYVTWGLVIILLLVIYVWSTVSFGCRFSNLTNRGIITEGPYRFVRHPAYLSKNLAWWLMYIPFAAHLDWLSAVKGCICLLLTNLIYIIRSKTEERHLLHDAAYKAYYQWIEENGLMAQLRGMSVVAKKSHDPKN